jgi:hypothetical protein
VISLHQVDWYRPLAKSTALPLSLVRVPNVTTSERSSGIEVDHRADFRPWSERKESEVEPRTAAHGDVRPNFAQLSRAIYRAQVVTYAIARLSNAVGRRLPFDEIWKEQDIPDDLKASLAKVIVGVRDVIIQPPGNRNITEWCKRDDCWSAILALPVEIDGAEPDHTPAAARPDQPTNADGTVLAVAAVPADVWFAVSKWAKDTRTLLPWQRSLAYSLGRLRVVEGSRGRSRRSRGAS